MPCFSNGPDPGTPEYEEWLPQVQKRYESFAHVVDYYYRKAGFPMPQPATSENWGEWLSGGRRLPDDALHPPSSEDNERVLRQILLHLDCDGVNVFHLNDIRCLFLREIPPTPRELGQGFVLNHCFVPLNWNKV